MRSAPRNDALLWPYLQASDEPDASTALEQLLCERAQPVIREVVGHKLRVVGDQDGHWDRNAYKTDAFFGQPLSDFAAP